MSEKIVKSNSKIENIKKILWIVIVVVFVLIAIIIIFVFSNAGKHETDRKEINISEIKPANEYTLEEYEALSPEEQAAFPDRFEDKVSFIDWLINAQIEAEANEDALNVPTIDLEDRSPDSFTWEEYIELSPEEQAVFPDYFDSMAEFNKWYEEVQGGKEDEDNNLEVPSVDMGEKPPEEFTWEEYLALPPEEQAVFPDYFDSMAEFNKWCEEAHNEYEGKDDSSKSNQLDIGNKAPEDYTWEDYKKLTIEEQMLFPDCFGTYDDFKNWYDKNYPGE